MKEQINSSAPVRTGRYAKSWAVKTTAESSQSLEQTVYSPSRYMLPEEFLTDILHEEKDANGVLTENANSEFERFALLFEFTGDKNAIRHVMYCCSASRPSMEGETKEDEKEVQTEELAIIASALANGYVKAKTSVNISDAIYNNWYNEVYMPTAAQEDSGNGSAEGGDSGNESGNDDENAGG